MQTQNNFHLSSWWLVVILALLTCYIIISPSNDKEQTSFKLKTGDLLFQDLDSSPLCDAIEKVTSGINNLNFSHIGIITIINKKEFVLEAFVNGVDTVSLDVFLNRNLNKNGNPKVVVGRLKNKYSNLIPKAIEKGMQLIGEKYDEEFKISNNKFYCSELIYQMFLEANKKNPFFKLNHMTYKVNDTTLVIWEKYFKNLEIPIPEGELGINPGAISLSKKIEIIKNYDY